MLYGAFHTTLALGAARERITECFDQALSAGSPAARQREAGSSAPPPAPLPPTKPPPQSSSERRCYREPSAAAGRRPRLTVRPPRTGGVEAERETVSEAAPGGLSRGTGPRGCGAGWGRAEGCGETAGRLKGERAGPGVRGAAGGVRRAAREAPRCKQGGAPPGASSRSPGGAAGTVAPRGAAVGGTGRRAAPPPPRPVIRGVSGPFGHSGAAPWACRRAELCYTRRG